MSPTGIAAVFEDESLRVGTASLPDVRMVCLFNWTDEAEEVSFRLPELAAIED